MAIAGAVVRWLRDNMSIIQSSAEIGSLLFMSQFFCNYSLMTLTLTNKHPLLSSLSNPRDAGSNSWNVIRLLLCPGFLWALRSLLGAKCKRVKQLLKHFAVTMGVRTALEQAVNDDVISGTGSSVGSPSSPTRATWPLLRWRPSASKPKR